jgi:hypothetical protein
MIVSRGANVTEKTPPIETTDITDLLQITIFVTTPTTTLSSGEIRNSFWEWRLQVLLWKCISPVLIISGIIFNSLTIIVLQRRKFGKSSTRMLLIVLAVSDTVVLMTGLLRQWFVYMFEFDLRVLTLVSCPVHIFFTYFSRHFASWNVPLLTVERWISVSFPLKVKVICTRKWTRVVLTTVFVFLFALNSHMLYFFRVKITACTYISQTYKYNFWVSIWYWIDMLAYSGIPFVVIVFCNCSILHQVTRGHIRRKTLQNPAGGRSDDASARLTSMTYMLTTVSVVFLLLTLPRSVSYIAYRYVQDTSRKWFFQKYLSWAVTNLLGYVNNTINFPLYCASGSQFRREVFAMFKDLRKEERIPTRAKKTG